MDARMKGGRRGHRRPSGDPDLEQRAELERDAFAASELNPKLFGKVIVREHIRKMLEFCTNGEQPIE